MELEDFFELIQQDIIADAQSRSLVRHQAFYENLNEQLIESGDISSNYQYAYHKELGQEVSGYGYDEDRQILSLTVVEYFEDLESVSQSQIDTKFKRLQGFLAYVFSEKYHDLEKNEVFDMANDIFAYKNADLISKIRLFLFTNGKATRNLKNIENSQIEGLDIEFRVIDISYLHQHFLLEGSGGDISVSMDIPCIPIDTKNSEYYSYLGVLSGPQIVEMYEEYGQKLFEQNVRTFLQFRGNVNKGLRETIRLNPERFFAYNNGITATASEVEIENGLIKNIQGLQIVNGGQTTSAIYSCSKRDKIDVENISVQIKLSVVSDPEKHGEFVSKVSEYANTQNKINKADFFSNSPFHIEFKELSKRITAPATDGGQRRTRWFYERVRGEYLNDQAYLSNSQKRRFQEDWPSKQKIEKTFISKSEISWELMPHIVAKGVSYSFDKFANHVTKKIEDNRESITDEYFKQVISRVIMFKAIEQIISKSEWYDGGYRAQTVTYSMAYLAYAISKISKYFDFNKIWEIQALPSNVESILKDITKNVYMSITEPPAGEANIAQWCKKEKCWENIKNTISINFDENSSFIVGADIQRTRQRAERDTARLTAGIQIQAFVLDRANRKIWAPLYEYCQTDDELSPMQMDILKKFSTGLMPLPTERQAKVIYELYLRAKNYGWEA